MTTTDEQVFRLDARAGSKEEWRRIQFRDAVKCVNESCADPAARGLERVVGLEHLDPEDLQIKRWANIAGGTSFSRVFRKGQVLFGKRRAYQRKAALADFDGICSGDILVFEARPDVLLPELLPFIVQSDGFFAHALGTSAGSLSPRTRWSDLATYEVALPPITEQKRIAAILWAANENQECLREVLDSASALKRAMLTEEFDGHEVATIALRDAGTWLSGGTPPKDDSSLWTGDLPWVSPKDMKVPLLENAQDHITHKACQDFSKIVAAGATLIVTRGMILAHTVPVCLAGRTLAFNQDIKAVVPSTQFDARFLFYYLQHRATALLQMVDDSTHGTKRLATGPLMEMRMPCPPMFLQRETVARLSKADSGMQAIEVQINAITTIKRGLINGLLGEENERVQ